jgi:hypothetical protein
MANACNTESGTVNIVNLPKLSEISHGEYLIVESDPGGTHILDYKDFIVGLDNVAFKYPFLQLQDENAVVGGLSSSWDSTHTTVLENSGQWSAFDSSQYNLACWDSTCTTVSANSANWDAVFNWGNHSHFGYLTRMDEVDPTVGVHIKLITTQNISRWNAVADQTGIAGCATPNDNVVTDVNRDVACIRNLTVTGEIRAGGDVIAFDQGNAGSTGTTTNTVAQTEFQFTAGSAIPCVSYSNIVGVFSDTANYFDVFPPAGYSMTNFRAFICSISYINFAGAVNNDDHMRCRWRLWHSGGVATSQSSADRIRVWVQNTEQRSIPQGNYMAVWKL